MVSYILAALLCAVTGNSDCIILKFTASWCGPCQQLQPSLDALANQGWTIQSVDTDQRPDLAQHFGVQDLPTLVILSGDQEVDRIVGVAPYEILQKRLARVAARGGGPSRHGQTASANQIASQPPSQQPALRGQQLHGQQPVVRGQSPGMLPVPDMASSLASMNRSAPPSAATRPSLNLDQAIQRAARATVRIQVDEGNTTAYGTGTIVDVHGSEALVLTCGHLFRDMQPHSQITVDLFAGTPQEVKLAAQLIDFQAEQADIGLLSFMLPVPIDPVEILPKNQQPQVNQPAFSFGCDHGAAPTRRDTRVVSIDRYLGAANIEIAGAPAVGRSGGGLFDTTGRLIGVCNAAVPSDNQGIYAGADVVYRQIDRLGLSHLFTDTALNPMANSAPASAVPHSNPAPLASGMGPGANTDSIEWPDETRNQGPGDLALAASANPRAPQATPASTPLNLDAPLALPQSPISGSSAAEIQSGPSAPNGSPSAVSQVICIVRDAQGRDQLVTIPKPSEALLRQIANETQR